MSKYTIEQQIKALDKLKHGTDFVEVMHSCDVSAYTLKKWRKAESQIRHAYREKLRAEADEKMIKAQHQIADKTIALLKAIDDDCIAKAPLNQISSALGVLIDRFLKLHDTEFKQDDEQDTAEQVIRIEYYDASTGEVSEAPPWAEIHSELSSPLQGGGMWQTLRQDDDGASHRNGKGSARDARLVARPDVSDGESGLARFEDGVDERDWYHD